MEVDEVDTRITAILEENGRVPNKEIAKTLSLSEGTIRNRIRKLTHLGFLKVKGLTNANLRTDRQIVYILVKVPLHSGWDETARKIAELSEVKSVSLLAGRFDLIVEAFLPTGELVYFINSKLASIEAIDSTETLISTKHYGKWV